MRNLLSGYCVLYVEDELSIQKHMAEYLEGYFGEVLVASNGEEALEVYNHCSPDALILDVDLPGLDGISVAQSIRKRDKKVSIVMLTAYTDQDKLLKATELKLLKYLVKPLDIMEFQMTLDLLAEELVEHSTDKVVLGDGYIWDSTTQKLSYQSKVVPLTSKEKTLLVLFIKYRNQSVSFEDIMAHVWEDQFDREISLNSVKNIVSNLRKNLPQDSIKNVYGKGYMLQ